MEEARSILSSFGRLLSAWLGGANASHLLGGAKLVVRWVSQHTGLPVLIVAAILVAVGYRVLKRSTRFAIEVGVVALVLLVISELGWIRW